MPTRHTPRLSAPILLAGASLALSSASRVTYSQQLVSSAPAGLLLPGSAFLTPPELGDGSAHLVVFIKRATGDTTDQRMSEVRREQRTVASHRDEVLLASSWAPPLVSVDTVIIERRGLAQVTEHLEYRGAFHYQYSHNHVTGSIQRLDSAARPFDQTFAQDIFAFSEVELLARSLPFNRGLSLVVPLFSESDTAAAGAGHDDRDRAGTAATSPRRRVGGPLRGSSDRGNALRGRCTVARDHLSRRQNPAAPNRRAPAIRTDIRGTLTMDDRWRLQSAAFSRRPHGIAAPATAMLLLVTSVHVPVGQPASDTGPASLGIGITARGNRPPVAPWIVWPAAVEQCRPAYRRTLTRCSRALAQPSRSTAWAPSASAESRRISSNSITTSRIGHIVHS